MIKKLFVLLCLIIAPAAAHAQQSAAVAYDKFMQLTSMFQGEEPYSCLAVVEIKYKRDEKKAVRDTSRLIYKNKATYYKSRLVERIEGAQGELIINHELQTATFQISDSVKLALQRELGIEPNKEFESLLDSNFERRDEDAFRRYVIEHCTVVWDSKNEIEEISFVPKTEGNEESVFLFMKIRFKGAKVLYYEYGNKEVYSTDWNGNNMFRRITTIYDDFKYDNVPDIPTKLKDYLEWDGWSVKLKKYTNYKFSLL